jgi:hypothetical protein
LENQTVLDFFLKFRKLNFILETDQFWGFCRFQQVAAFNNRRAGSDSRRWHRTMLPDSFRSLRKKHGTFALPRHQPIHPPTTTAPRRRRCPPARNQPAYHHEMVARWIGIAAALPGYALARSRICRPIIRQTRLIPHPARSCTFCPREKKKLKRECTVHTYAASKAA